MLSSNFNQKIVELYLGLKKGGGGGLIMLTSVCTCLFLSHKLVSKLIRLCFLLRFLYCCAFQREDLLGGMCVT